MKPITYLSEEELIRKAIHLLMEQLGPVNTHRFLPIPSQKRLDSVKRHQKWQGQLDKDDFFDQVFPSE